MSRIPRRLVPWLALALALPAGGQEVDAEAAILPRIDVEIPRAEKAGAPSPAVLPEDAPTVFPQPSPTERCIRQALDQQIEFDFLGTPLADVATRIRDAAGIPVHLDRKGLALANVETDEPVTLKAGGITLRSMLHLVLDDLELAYVVEDEVLKITDRTLVAERFVLRIYAVGDLAAADGLDTLERMARCTVAPDSWDEAGGDGEVVGSPVLGVLAVRQTHDVHEKVERLFAALRQSVRQRATVAASP